MHLPQLQSWQLLLNWKCITALCVAKEIRHFQCATHVVTITVEGEGGTQDVSCLAWALTNRENQPQSEVAGFESVILPSALDEGTTYNLDSTGVITTH